MQHLGVRLGRIPSLLAHPAKAMTPSRLGRLLYVGLTRAKHTLWLSWSGRPSRFLRELGVQARPVADRKEWTPDGERLRAWRLERARADNVPPYVVFHDSVLQAIAAARPASLGELAQISGIGPAKLERYGDEVLAVVEG